jgi:hypothetical protein
MLPRADAGSTTLANPTSDTIANAVTASLQDIPNVSRNTLTSAADRSGQFSYCVAIISAPVLLARSD